MSAASMSISLHHSIDGDLSHGRQLHGFVLSLVVVFGLSRLTAPRRGPFTVGERFDERRLSISATVGTASCHRIG
jgi:hypothetical protein